MKTIYIIRKIETEMNQKKNNIILLKSNNHVVLYRDYHRPGLITDNKLITLLLINIDIIILLLGSTIICPKNL